MATKVPKRVYLAFEYEKDAERRISFINQSIDHCDFQIIDLSLPSPVHDEHWQREARNRIRDSEFVIILLGEDTHTSQGVKDEVSLAGQFTRPIFQLQPQKRRYGLVFNNIPWVRYKWNNINRLLGDSQSLQRKNHL